MTNPEFIHKHEQKLDATYEECLRSIWQKREPIVDLLTRTQVIEAVQFNFDFQFEAQKRMRAFCTHFGNDHWRLDMMSKMEKLRLADMFTLKFNIEFDDFTANCEKYDIMESPEVQTILENVWRR